LVDAARRDPTVRIVRRVYEPGDLDRAAPIDIVVVGAETSWITSSRIRSLRGSGTRVIGVYPSGDGPGRALLERGGADAALPDSTPPEDLLQAATAVASESLVRVQAGRLISVTGPRGAPGRTEIAVALAEALATTKSTALVDLDVDAPGVGLRLGLRPGPDLHDIVDSIRAGDQETLTARRSGNLTVIAGPGPSRAGSNGAAIIAELLDTVVTSFEASIADIGPWQPGIPCLATSDAIVLVCEAHPGSLIRAARAVHDWEGPMPLVALNRVEPGNELASTRLARRALGLEPTTLIPEATAGTVPDALAARIGSLITALS
jgi:MinD-like ATPase involved in chromosome partitioning or flagellar assembly